ncbi:MAG TPA: zinc ribbon domain-containing protein [Bryobacteraceae bacterium]|jgi:putative FmdB family regulatory protein|nr:zinc ribbon domain-containing protein [Bryobacteraceae bacterium]
MPIYDYECGKCAKQFELIVLSSTVIACPYCESPDLKQMLSPFAVSSDGTRSTSLQAARRRHSGSSGYRDQKKAEAESHMKALKEHDH